MRHWNFDRGKPVQHCNGPHTTEGKDDSKKEDEAMNERGGMKTHPGRKWAIGVFVGIFIALMGWAVFGPERKPDLAKVDPWITELQEPMKIDFTFHPNEPQSCIFWIEDHTGKTLLISINKLYTDPEVYLSSIRNPECMTPTPIRRKTFCSSRTCCALTRQGTHARS